MIKTMLAKIAARMRPVARRTFAIRTVFIAMENILFMEELIDYHLRLGFTKFYLYDNSKTRGMGAWYRSFLNDRYRDAMVAGAINKYGINYRRLVSMSDGQVTDLLRRIADKYRGHVALIEWSPMDDNGAAPVCPPPAAMAYNRRVVSRQPDPRRIRL